MPITIQSVGGFIPQTNIKISDTRINTLLSNIRIERKVGGDDFVTIIATDSSNNQFNYTDVNEFGKIYVYRVSYDVYQKQTVQNTTTNKANFWKENFILNDLKIDSTGKLYGTGTAVAKDSYLKKLNSDGTTHLNLSAWIGNGGDKAGKNNSTYDNIAFVFRTGTSTFINKWLLLTKAWDSAKAYSKRFWYYLNKRDINGKRVQIQLTKDSADGIDIQLYFKKSGSSYTYGFSSKMNTLKTTQALSSKGGRATRFSIRLKNNAKLSPDFTVKVTSPPTYKYVLLNTYTHEQTIIVKDEPDVDYGIVMNEYGEGFRFTRYEPNGLQNSSGYETKSASQILDIHDSEYPLVYVADNKKTPSTDFTILTSNLAYRNRMRNQVIRKNYIYIFTPKIWNYQLISGFYAYETVTEERIGYSDDIYAFNFNGARQVLNSVIMPPKWSYERLKDLERNYVSVIDNYKDYGDLAVSPTGNEILGERESDIDEIL
ncbi:hypothetical protein LJB88_02125 [Erysipelotrichaceae bacterium OttesenSCG-928-M19]|nr:hypothetical protein [Erysipelotrichaceae bacterium OttesenSCG-928-M19]